MNAYIKRTIGGALLACSAIFLLSSCSAGGSMDTKSSERSSTPATPGVPKLEKVTAQCEDGESIITAANKQVTLGDCEKVTVKASNAVVKLGDVRKLIVTSSISGISAGNVKELTVTGSGNVINTTNSDVEVSNTGKQNDINKN